MMDNWDGGTLGPDLTEEELIQFMRDYGMRDLTDAVQVVRCVDCSNSEVCKMDEGDVRYCHIYEMQTEDDYYCADGKRRSE